MFDRAAHWQQVYETKSPLEVSWYQQEPRLSLELIEHARIDPVGGDGGIIDVGGGASLLVDRLCALGYRQLAVLDISASALAWARERLGEQAAAIDWINCDITRFVPPRRYALWHDRAVFHFLTEAADRAAYRAALEQALVPGGQLIIGAFAIGGPLQCSGLDIVQYDAAKLQQELGDGFELLEQTSEQHRTPAGKDQAFNFCRFRRL
ncbi:MAG: methyltransferase domain-containing protein [Gammaproteobacteria bacterium]|nr:methyltransferase domain-containing protein [Gammaproteobacteria bacterium]